LSPVSHLTQIDRVQIYRTRIELSMSDDINSCYVLVVIISL